MRPRSTSCWSPKSCRCDDGVERRRRQPAFARRRRAPRGRRSASPSRCSRRSHRAPTDYGRVVRAQIPHVPMLRGHRADAARHRAARARPARGRSIPATFIAPPADSDLARIAGARAPRRSTARPRSTRSNPSRCCGPTASRLPQEQLVEHARRSALTAAHRIGFPVVLKAVSAALPHKSDAGLVLSRSHGCRRRAAGAAQLIARCTSALPLRSTASWWRSRFGRDRMRAWRAARRRRWARSSCSASAASGRAVQGRELRAGVPRSRRRPLRWCNATRAGRAARRLPRPQARRSSTLCATRWSISAGSARDLGDVIEAIDINPFAGARAWRVRARRPRGAARRRERKMTRQITRRTP